MRLYILSLKSVLEIRKDEKKKKKKKEKKIKILKVNRCRIYGTADNVFHILISLPVLRLTRAAFL